MRLVLLPPPPSLSPALVLLLFSHDLNSLPKKGAPNHLPQTPSPRGGYPQREHWTWVLTGKMMRKMIIIKVWVTMIPHGQQQTHSNPQASMTPSSALKIQSKISGWLSLCRIQAKLIYIRNHTCNHDTCSRPQTSLSYQVLKILKFVHLLRRTTFYNFYQSYKHVHKDDQQNQVIQPTIYGQS